jgi:glycine cleavage system H lipoate-binding protein
MKTNRGNKKIMKKNRVIGFQVLENECIWMKAGVVNFRLCDCAYDCNICAFDKGMRRAMGLKENSGAENESPAWVDYLKQKYHGSSRPCRHALTGRIDAPKICTLNYECYHCSFDQMLDESDLVRLSDSPGYKLASGYKLADGYYYHMGHSWARFEHGGRVRVGFDDFLVKIFGAFGSVILPPLGGTLKQNQVGWTVGRDSNQAAALSPMTGTVLAVNRKAEEHPEITHEDPYHEGWLFMIEPHVPKKDLKGLYFGKESFKWMEQESQKLMGLMGPEYEKLAATGGEPIGDVFGNFPEIGWEKLAGTFLRTKSI